MVQSAPPDHVVLPWQLNRTDPAANRVYLSVTGRDCSIPKVVTVQEHPRTITITAYGTKPPSGPCTAQATTMVGFITTNSPIDDRSLIHGE